MKFTKPAEMSWWSAGGGVTSKAGPIPLTLANDLYGFFAFEALNADRIRDRDGARYCARQAIQLFQAITQAERWARAAGRVRAGKKDIAA